MRILGFEIGRANEVSNVDVKQKEVERIIQRITKSQLTRTRQDIGIWRGAVAQAENVKTPKRTELIRTYSDAMLDAHLSSLIQTRILKVTGHEFTVVNDKGEIDVEKTELLKTEWFEKFVKYSLESIFYGYSLIQFGGIVNDGFESIEVVPREYVIPEKLGVMKKAGADKDLISINEKPFAKWLMFIDSGELGLINKACPHSIWKKNAVGSWSEFSEKFGQPIRIGKTSSGNKENRENLENMLENMGANAWGVFDEMDELQLIEASKSDAHSVFNELIERANSEMSKLIVGQTMTSDNGSSLSQSEVHERILNDYFKHDLTFISNLVNKRLFPFMEQHGISFSGFKFSWDTSERLSLKEQFEIDKTLMQSFDLDIDYLRDKYKTPIIDKKPTQIFGYHIDNGVVQTNDVRKQLGLEEIDETEINARNEIKEKLSIVQTAVQSGVPLDEAVKVAKLDINIKAGQLSQKDVENVFFKNSISKYYE